MTRDVFKTINIAIAAALLTGCPFKIETTPATNDTITKATTNVKDGLAALGNGLDQLSRLDPAGINRLLTENQGLREQVEKITTQLSKAAGQGVIEIATRNVEIRVASYTGAFTVNGWVDEETNKFWLTKTFNRKDFSFGDENSNLAPITQESIRRFGNNTFQAWDNIARASQSYLLQKVRSFLSTNTTVPGQDSDGISLNTSLGGLNGVHKIILQVTPTAYDSAMSWSISFKTILRNTDSSTVTIREFDLTSATNPNHRLNQPLPRIEQVLFVKLASN